MSAIEILKKLDKYETLEPLQRILLINDGTLTEVLEAAFLERIELIKVAQDIIPSGAARVDNPEFENETLLKRKILLQGANSKRNYAYAESLIAVDRLSPKFRDDLLQSNMPIGRLWLEHKLETFKEIQKIIYLNANDLGQHFLCSDNSLLLVRTYCVYSKGKPLISITEYFPPTYPL